MNKVILLVAKFYTILAKNEASDFFNKLTTICNDHRLLILGSIGAVAGLTIAITALKLVAFPNKETKAESKDKFKTILGGVVIGTLATTLVTIVLGALDF